MSLQPSRVARPKAVAPGPLVAHPQGYAPGSRSATCLAILVWSDRTLLGSTTHPQFLAARIAKVAQWIHRLVIQDFLDIAKGFVRRQIRFDDHAHHSVSVLNNRWRRQHAHPT